MNPLLRLFTRRKPLVLFPSIVRSNLSIFSSSFLNPDNYGMDTSIIGSAEPAPKGVVAPPDYTIGRHLAQRLAQVGVSDVFSVRGELNRTLVDHLTTADTDLNVIGCCNELNAGYAADGYARRRGVGACVVNSVAGCLSMFNAIAGAYKEDLPVICINGGLNSDYYGIDQMLHIRSCLKTVTCFQAMVSDHKIARELIDAAIDKALRESKPVYISISCNLSAILYPSSGLHPLPYYPFFRKRRMSSLARAAEYAAAFLNQAVKPVLVGGPKLSTAEARDSFAKLADASGYPTAMLPASAKGLVPEHTSKILKSAGAYIFVGPGSVKHSFPLKKKKAILVHPEGVEIANKFSFPSLYMEDFLWALAEKLEKKNTTHENKAAASKEPLTVNVLFERIQYYFLSEYDVEDSYRTSAVFLEIKCQKLKLPMCRGYEDYQIQRRCIGWSLGATLGYVQAARQSERAIACIDARSFQVADMEISTMLRCGHNTIIFLVNNGGFRSEILNNLDYTAFVDVIPKGKGKCWTAKVSCEVDLNRAIYTATVDKKDCLCFIEVIVHKNHTSKELLEWISVIFAPKIFSA